MEGQHRPDRNWSILSFASRGANDISRLGGPASHGSVRLHPAHAATFVRAGRSQWDGKYADRDLLEHDPEECRAVFRKDHAQTRRRARNLLTAR
jgi:hypothetical protein